MAKQAIIDVIINNEAAKQKYEELQNELKKMKTLRDDAMKAGDVTAWKVYDAELKTARKELNGFVNNFSTVEEVLKNITKVSKNDLKTAFNQARAELDSLSRDSDKYAGKKANFEKLRDEMEKINATTKSQVSWFAKAGDGFNRYFGMATAAIASFTGIFLGLKQTITDFNEYQAKVANLSALTGLKGGDLDWISNKAKELSTSITEEGVRITQGADVIVDAFTKMGSAKPELLKDKEALSETTKQAIILSEAAKMELAPAVDGLALTMNQFGAGAKEAGRYVNVLAAGSKEGAAEIPDISAAIVKFGAAAKTANVSVEESVGLIEALSEKGIKGEIAGTGLKTMLVKMMTGADEFNPKVVGMQQSLENLSKANLSAAQLTKMFGLENYTVVKSLIDSKDRVNELTKAVTGTNVAYEQANINTDTNAAKLEQQKNKIKLISIELGEKLAPIMSSSLGIFTKFMQVLIASINFYAKHSFAINTAVAAITAYVAVSKTQIFIAAWKNRLTTEGTKATILENLAMKASAAWHNTVRAATLLTAAAKALLTGNTIRANAAMKLLRGSISGGMWGAMAVGVVALGVALYNMATRATASQKALEALNSVEADARKEVLKQKNALAELVLIAQNETLSKNQRADAIRRINAMSPEYLGNITLETINTEGAKSAIDRYNESLLRTARIKSANKRLDELADKEVDLETKGSELTTWQKISSGLNWISSGGDNDYVNEMKKLYKNKNNRDTRSEINAEREAILEYIEKNKEGAASESEFNKATGNGNTGGGGPASSKSKEWSLNADKEFNKAKLALQKQRLNDEIKTDEELNEKILQLEIKTLQDRLRLTTISVKERGELEQQLVDKQITAKNNQITKQAKIDQERHDAQKKLIEDTAKNNEKALNDLKIKNNEEFASITSLEKVKSLLKDSMSAEELKKITNLYDGKQALRKKYDKEEQQLAITQSEALLAIYEDIAKNGMIGPMGALSPEQIKELQGTIDKLKSQISEMKASASVGEKPEENSKEKSKDLPTAKVDILGFTPENWQTLFDNISQGKLLTEDWHETLSAGINMAGNSMIDIWKSYGEIVSKTDQKELNRFIKNQDSKKKTLSKRLEQGRISQESYNAAVEAMDSETERKKAIADRNAAKRERDIALMSAIVNTASAMVSSLKTDPSGILATWIGIMGGIQIKKIMATPLPELPGAETGGEMMDVVRSQDGKRFRAKNDPTLRGFVHKPTIITGENGTEYILPEEALNNPSIRNMVNFIEQARLNGSLSRINLPMIQQVAGREAGGYNSSSKTTSERRTETTIYREQTAQLNEFTEVMKQVRDVLSKPIEAKTYLRGPRGIYEAMKEDEILKNNAKK